MRIWHSWTASICAVRSLDIVLSWFSRQTVNPTGCIYKEARLREARMELFAPPMPAEAKQQVVHLSHEHTVTACSLGAPSGKHARLHAPRMEVLASALKLVGHKPKLPS